MEACRQIIKRDPDAKIIFVTAHALDEFKSKAESVGAVSFISKPFRVSDIDSVLERIGVCSSGISPYSMKKIPTEPYCSLNPPFGQAEQHATGSMQVNEKVNEKANITPDVPIAPQLVPSPSPPVSLGIATPPLVRAKRLSTASRNLKVLYAEDNPINQKVLTCVLNRTGINDVTIVDNGKKAVDATSRSKFDCIFMDFEMPIMDGMEATEIIMKEHPDSKIVFVTAHALDEYKAKAVSVGAKDFLAKPVKVTDIEGVLKKLNLF
jgi:CheY-like chemotaxis protein